jgi:5-aminolevulinate synthase
MEALLRQSKSMCPFLHKTSPATLRSLSTTTVAAARHEVSPGAGSMSNLQVLARRCPIMGKALAVQSSRNGNNALAGAFGGVRAYHTRVNRARLHTTASKEAQAVDIESLRGKQGTRFPTKPKYSTFSMTEIVEYRLTWRRSTIPARSFEACER